MTRLWIVVGPLSSQRVQRTTVQLQTLGIVGKIDRTDLWKKRRDFYFCSQSDREVSTITTVDLEADQVTGLYCYKLKETASDTYCEFILHNGGEFSGEQILALVMNFAVNGPAFLCEDARNLFFTKRSVFNVVKSNVGWSVYGLSRGANVWFSNDCIYRAVSAGAPQVKDFENPLETELA